MPRSPSSFRKTDVTRLINAAIASGMKIARIEVDHDGKIAVISGNDASDESSENTANNSNQNDFGG